MQFNQCNKTACCTHMQHGYQLSNALCNIRFGVRIAVGTSKHETEEGEEMLNLE